MPDALQLLLTYKYWILFPLACFEGPVVALLAGFLVSLGYLNPFISYIILVFGDIIPDGLYYLTGRYGDPKKFIEKYGKHLGLKHSTFEAIEDLWHTHGKKTMLFTKFAYGLSTPFLISAGLVRLPVRRFFLYTISISMTQYIVLLVVGFYLGNSYRTMADYIGYAEIFVAVLGVAVITIYYFLRKRLKEELTEFEKFQK